MLNDTYNDDMTKAAIPVNPVLVVLFFKRLEPKKAKLVVHLFKYNQEFCQKLLGLERWERLKALPAAPRVDGFK